jgi:hypothetical protein
MGGGHTVLLATPFMGDLRKWLLAMFRFGDCRRVRPKTGIGGTE